MWIGDQFWVWLVKWFLQTEIGILVGIFQLSFTIILSGGILWFGIAGWRATRFRQLGNLEGLLIQLYVMNNAVEALKLHFKIHIETNPPSWTIPNIDLNSYIPVIKKNVRVEWEKTRNISEWKPKKKISTSRLRFLLAAIVGYANTINNLLSIIHTIVSVSPRKKDLIQKNSRELSRGGYIQAFERSSKELEKEIKLFLHKNNKTVKEYDLKTKKSIKHHKEIYKRYREELQRISDKKSSS